MFPMASGGTLFMFIFAFFRRGIFSELELEALPEALLEFDLELEALLEFDVVDFTTLDKA
jgi:hypothetical protein